MNKMTELAKIPEQKLYKFTNKLFSDKLTAPTLKFVNQACLGMLASGDIKVTGISRNLPTDKSFKATTNRLYTHLQKAELWQTISGGIVDNFTAHLATGTILSMDFTDLSKPYAQAMEGLETVRNGDTGQIGSGYRVLMISAASSGQTMPVPVVTDVFSQAQSPDQCLSAWITRHIQSICQATPNRFTWVVDRFFDTNWLITLMNDENQDFVIRLKTNRKGWAGKTTRQIPENRKELVSAATYLSCQHDCILSYWDNGKHKQSTKVRVGVIPVRFKKLNIPMFMVVVKGFGKTPMMLLTNKAEAMTDPVSILKAYRLRWEVEEYTRFVKEQFQFEDIRSKKFVSLKNLTALLLLANHFLIRMIALGSKMKIVFTTLLNLAKPVKSKKAKYHAYKVALGIKYLFRFLKGSPPRPIQKQSGQFALNFS